VHIATRAREGHKLDFKPKDPEYEAKVRESFVRQKVMGTFGASLTHISPGRSEVRLPFKEELTQQHGFLHAGVVASVMDSACGYATLSLAPPRGAVLAVEFKVNFLSPAVGDEFVARGAVVKAGRNLCTCTAEGLALSGGKEKLVATMLSTIMIVARPGLEG
jgi:uncharacterized protein (TIGR00369 family)